MSSVLVVSRADDAHLPPVIEAIRRRNKGVVVLELTSIPRGIPVTVGHDELGSWGARMALPRGGHLRNADIAGVWWRRPGPCGAPETTPPEDRAFVATQVAEAMTGFWSTLTATWVNDPWNDQRASHKPPQLQIAARIGLEVPRTLIPTRGSEIRDFLSRFAAHRIVIKLLAADAEHGSPTRFVTAVQEDRLPEGPVSPVILQVYVPGIDVRVTVVGNQVFAASIDARKTSSPEDFRPVYSKCRVAVHTLADREKRMILEMTRTLGLAYAAFDFRRTDDGRLVFLEVNPAGQWLFVERRTRQPIADALGALLCTASDRVGSEGGRPFARRAA